MFFFSTHDSVVFLTVQLRIMSVDHPLPMLAGVSSLEDIYETTKILDSAKTLSLCHCFGQNSSRMPGNTP